MLDSWIWFRIDFIFSLIPEISFFACSWSSLISSYQHINLLQANIFQLLEASVTAQSINETELNNIFLILFEIPQTILYFEDYEIVQRQQLNFDEYFEIEHEYRFLF